MTPLPRRLAGVAVCLICALPVTGVAFAPARAAAPAAASAIDPEAIRALDRMGRYLRSVKAFELNIDTSLEQTVGSRRESVSLTSLYKVQRPDRAYAEYASQGRAVKVYLRGGDLVAYSPARNRYVRHATHATLKQNLDALYKDYGFRIPVTRLIWFDSKSGLPGDLTSARRVGVVRLNGVNCISYVLRKDGLDWEVWIRQDQRPVPLKLVISDPKDPAKSRYTSRLTWTLFPVVRERDFEFKAPAGAVKTASLDR